MAESLVEHVFSSLPKGFQPQKEVRTGEVIAFQAFVDGLLGLAGQQSISTAQNGWLDVWGNLFGLSRNVNEADSSYRARILSVLEKNVGTTFAIESLGKIFFGSNAQILENFPNVGYIIIVPPNVSSSQIQAFQNSLSTIRPAGVPFTIQQTVGENSLDTHTFISGQSPDASYLISGNVNIPVNIPSFTTNIFETFPTILLTDPLLS